MNRCRRFFSWVELCADFAAEKNREFRRRRPYETIRDVRVPWAFHFLPQRRSRRASAYSSSLSSLSRPVVCQTSFAIPKRSETFILSSALKVIRYPAGHMWKWVTLDAASAQRWGNLNLVPARALANSKGGRCWWRRCIPSARNVSPLSTYWYLHSRLLRVRVLRIVWRPRAERSVPHNGRRSIDAFKAATIYLYESYFFLLSFLPSFLCVCCCFFSFLSFRIFGINISAPPGRLLRSSPKWGRKWDDTLAEHGLVFLLYSLTCV